MKNKVILSLLIPSVVFIFGPKLWAVCPGCGTILEGSTATAFNLSVLFMMAMPFLVVGSIVVGFLIINKKQPLDVHSGSVPQEVEGPHS